MNTPDWADELAKETLYYLALCESKAREAQYLAAAFRREYARGKVDAGEQLRTALKLSA